MDTGAIQRCHRMPQSTAGDLTAEVSMRRLADTVCIAVVIILADAVLLREVSLDNAQLWCQRSSTAALNSNSMHIQMMYLLTTSESFPVSRRLGESRLSSPPWQLTTHSVQASVSQHEVRYLCLLSSGSAARPCNPHL